jgi:GT2 family glycosyltransferase
MHSIIIVTYNSEKHIANCLSSMIKSSPKDTEIIIVDNSGKNYQMDNVIVNKSGSYPSGLNQGIAVASGEYLTCCNPDIIVEPEWLEKLKWGLDQGYGIIGPVSNFASGIQAVPIPWPEQVNMIDVSFIIGFCFMIKKETFEKIGPFDEDFIFENDDIDYSIRIRQAGYPIGVMPHVRIHHVGHQSMTSESKESLEKRWTSFYKLFKKYPDMNFIKYMGCNWHVSWFHEVLKRYPDIKSFRSFNEAFEVAANFSTKNK